MMYLKCIGIILYIIFCRFIDLMYLYCNVNVILYLLGECKLYKIYNMLKVVILVCIYLFGNFKIQDMI